MMYCISPVLSPWCSKYNRPIVRKYESLFRLNHHLPWREAHNEGVQCTTDFRQEVADALLAEMQHVPDDPCQQESSIYGLRPTATSERPIGG
jgi:hypothetical protein